MNIIYHLQDIWHGIRHFPRRVYYRYKYGISCCKAFSLDYEWTKQLIREINGYRNVAGKAMELDIRVDGKPSFNEDIDKILKSLNMIINDEQTLENCKEYDAEIQEGLDLFAKRFRHFWY